MKKFQAYVLVQTTADKTINVATSILEVDSVKTVNIVTGPYDVIVLMEGDDPQIIGRIIMEKIRLIPGIVETLTCVVIG
ncbi:MAG: Lrp/AsnC ligand binding domain-containing protein [Anaerolineales bacterium]|nr:Lrp/AsnC ligand binding domain-containing protein [Anaerolineales bacterium]